MSTRRAAIVFVAGYFVGALIVEIVAWVHDGTTMSGLIMLGLSSPTTLIYFIALVAVGKWQLLSPTFASMAINGFLSAVFPTFSGYFPVYFMRLQFAAPLILAQFGVLFLTAGILAHLQRRSG